MSYFLPHLPSGWHVDQAILAEENRVVIIRFGHDWPDNLTLTEPLCFCTYHASTVIIKQIANTYIVKRFVNYTVD
ncbi:hypothetical protein PSHT_00034 [Puccinia striiformis]|uniref:Uncharacterized protein n=1 Tax=Puccinia striiformis TaxID=27350 RepID=A0A2S4WNR2_9BASI|nr:hypothetical protein PSHT_00034 [Puccinia striiformis]